MSVCWAGVLFGMRDDPGKGQRVCAICRPVPGATRLRRPPNVSNRKKRKDERQQLAWDLILPARHNVSCDKRQRLKVRRGLLLLLLLLLFFFFFLFFFLLFFFFFSLLLLLCFIIIVFLRVGNGWNNTQREQTERNKASTKQQHKPATLPTKHKPPFGKREEMGGGGGRCVREGGGREGQGTHRHTDTHTHTQSMTHTKSCSGSLATEV